MSKHYYLFRSIIGPGTRHGDTVAGALVLSCLFVFTIVISGCNGAGAAAPVTLEIWPYEMTPVTSGPNVRQQPTLITSTVPSSSGPTNVAYYAVVNIPVGKEILSVDYYYKGTSVAAYTGLFLMRNTLGGTDEMLFSGNASGDTSGAISTISVPATASTPIMVEAGYRYYVFVSTENAESIITGIKIQYQ